MVFKVDFLRNNECLKIFKKNVGKNFQMSKKGSQERLQHEIDVEKMVFRSIFGEITNVKKFDKFW